MVYQVRLYEPFELLEIGLERDNAKTNEKFDYLIKSRILAI